MLIWGGFIGFTVSLQAVLSLSQDSKVEKRIAESGEDRLWFSTTEMNRGFCSTGNLLSFLLLSEFQFEEPRLPGCKMWVFLYKS